MAYLSTSSVCFELTPVGRDNTRSGEMQWITCRLGMYMRLLGQGFPIPAEKLIAMPYTDSGRLVNWVKEFVERLSKLPIGQPHSGNVEPFTFVPMQLDFLFACLEGDVSEDLEGVVSLRIMLNLSSLGDQYRSEYFGVETSADPKQLIEFVNTLEREADRAINPSHTSADSHGQQMPEPL